MKYIREENNNIIASCERCNKELKIRKSSGKVMGDYYVLDFPLSCKCGYMDKNIKDIKLTKVEAEVVEKVPVPKKVEEAPIDYVIKCPNCKSTKVKKISGLSKAGSVALFGIFALGKVIRTYECKSCSYRW